MSFAEQLQEARGSKLAYTKDGPDLWVVEVGTELIGEWERSGVEMNPRMATSKPSWTFVPQADDPKIQAKLTQANIPSFDGRSLPGAAKKWLASQLKGLL